MYIYCFKIKHNFSLIKWKVTEWCSLRGKNYIPYITKKQFITYIDKRIAFIINASGLPPRGSFFFFFRFSRPLSNRETAEVVHLFYVARESGWDSSGRDVCFWSPDLVGGFSCESFL